jgi:hypothetical protein
VPRQVARLQQEAAQHRAGGAGGVEESLGGGGSPRDGDAPAGEEFNSAQRVMLAQLASFSASIAAKEVCVWRVREVLGLCGVCAGPSGVWCVVCGVWCVVCGVWCVVCGCLVCGVCFLGVSQ